MPGSIKFSLASLALAGLLLGAGCGASRERPKLTVERLAGDVRIANGGAATSDAINPSGPPAQLTEGSRVETGPASWAELRFLPGTVVRIGANTIFEVSVFTRLQADDQTYVAATSFRGRDSAAARVFLRVNHDRTDPRAPKFSRFEVKSGAVVTTAVTGGEVAIDGAGGRVSVFRHSGDAIVDEENDTGTGAPAWAAKHGYSAARQAGRRLGTLGVTTPGLEVSGGGDQNVKSTITVLQLSGQPCLSELGSWLRELDGAGKGHPGPR